MEKNMNELSNSLSRTTRQYYRDVSSTVLTLSNVKQALSKFDDKTVNIHPNLLLGIILTKIQVEIRKRISRVS